MPAQPKPSNAKAPAKKRTPAPKPRAKSRKPGHAAIAERAYFIHLEEGTSDELTNWLRAERELMAA
jgi:Protein of unknown function (DUF2934)